MDTESKTSQTKNFSSLQHRYLDERFTNLEKMLITSVNNQEKITLLAKESAEKAVEKAEKLAQHNQEISNEFQEKLKDQAKCLISRNETLTRFDNVDSKITVINKDITELREFRSSHSGNESKRIEDKANNQWIIGISITLAGALIAFSVYLSKIDYNYQNFQRYNQSFQQTNTQIDQKTNTTNSK